MQYAITKRIPGTRPRRRLLGRAVGRALVAGAALTALTPAFAQSTVTVATRGAYVLLNSDPDAVPATRIDLAAIGVSPGTEIRLEQLGDFVGCQPCEWPDELTGLTGVFSASDTLLPPDQPQRVVDALDAGEDYVTPPTFFGALPTDISEDFLITDIVLTVPDGAQYLYVASVDNWYSDNADFDGDLAVRITSGPGPLPLPGDLNCDGAVNFGDINPFVLALANPALWAETYPDCNPLNGDINGDETVGFGDINAFVALLSGGA